MMPSADQLSCYIKWNVVIVSVSKFDSKNFSTVPWINNQEHLIIDFSWSNGEVNYKEYLSRKVVKSTFSVYFSYKLHKIYEILSKYNSISKITVATGFSFALWGRSHSTWTTFWCLFTPPFLSGRRQSIYRVGQKEWTVYHTILC